MEMDPNPNTNPMPALPEEAEDLDDVQHEENKEKPPSVFASVPPRPATQSPATKYSPLQWEGHFDKEEDINIPASNSTFHVYSAGTEGPVVFCLHGGGNSGLSFALVAGMMKQTAQIVAMDLRGHGKSHSDDEIDISTETLCQDILAVIRMMFGDDPPAIVLVGHSMGGAIAVHLAAKRVLSSLAGLVVVDVVEGTAMASLVHMQKILSNRPCHFPSVEKAIEWSIKNGHLRNPQSARISVPSTVKFDDKRQCYVWRTPLEKTEHHWKGWYEGLSEMFLSCPIPKLLLLAGTDRLDRSLTIGQMQGKFQMIVIRHTGHAIQEDVPDEFSSKILNFISRNRIGPHGVEIPGLRR
uniref:Protein phosphatase methylesterase 1 n=1 Tax=Araucaria cunninghamii TaxID=56994 RepID=A0A0D6R5T4_ARACU